jgi:hypothetical protein
MVRKCSSLAIKPVLTHLQPAFQAINLEPEENEDEQIDTTKELHVGHLKSPSNLLTCVLSMILGR